MEDSDEVGRARALIRADREARLEACKREIEAALLRHRCALQAQVVIDGSAVSSTVSIVDLGE